MLPAVRKPRRRFWRHVWALIFGFSWVGPDGHRYGREPKRTWTAHNPFGFSEVGYMTRTKALATVAKWGKVNYVDEAHGLIFYDTHLGRDNSAS